jgi:DNA-directed RNA polymerase specialized sigma24 family protein
MGTLPETMTTAEVCAFLGISFSAWRSRQIDYLTNFIGRLGGKLPADRTNDDKGPFFLPGRTKPFYWVSWMPKPVSGSAYTLNSVYKTSDILDVQKRPYFKKGAELSVTPTPQPVKTVTMGQVLACLGLEKHAQWAELVRSSHRYAMPVWMPKPVSIQVMKDGRLLWGTAIYREADILKYIEGWKREVDISALSVPAPIRVPGRPCAWPEPIPKTYPDLFSMYGQDIEKVVRPHFSTEDFEDALQDVYVRLCTSNFLAKWDSSFEKGPPSKQRIQFQFYLRTMVHRTCLNLCRTMSRRWKDRSGSHKTQEVEPEILLDEQTDARIEARDEISRFRASLARRKQPEAQVIEQLLDCTEGYGNQSRRWGILWDAARWRR